jgi:hypothetical protein
VPIIGFEKMAPPTSWMVVLVAFSGRENKRLHPELAI